MHVYICIYIIRVYTLASEIYVHASSGQAALEGLSLANAGFQRSRMHLKMSIPLLRG